MPKYLETDQIEAYNQNGFVGPIDLLTLDEAEKLRRKVEEVVRAKTPLVEDVVDQLRSVVKKKKEQDIKFKSGTEVPIDPESAKVILKTYDSLNTSNKKKMQKQMNTDSKSFLKVLDFAFENVIK